jgi:Glycosyl transferase family 2
MEDKKLACIMTMVRDDYFFLERWVRYYGEMFGRDALYVVNHGNGEKIKDIAAGCNVIGIPDVFNEKFDAMRWRLLNNLAQGLRGYYNYVLIGDVDEFVVVDPKTEMNLADFLGKRRGKNTITPIGLEVVHQPALEPEGLDGPMLGPRRYARFTTAYSKPCIFNHHVEISRGGHYATDPELKIFKNVYMFHMRYVDAQMYSDTLARRGKQVERIAQSGDDTMISWQWRQQDDKPDPYQVAAQMPIGETFDVEAYLKRMYKTWGVRDDKSGLHHVARQIGKVLMPLPERFFGLI